MNYNWVWQSLLNLMPNRLKSFTIEDNPVGYTFSCEFQNGERLFTDFWDLKELALFLEMNNMVE